MTSADGPRIACADVAALPLQLLAVREPGWTAHPVAVVERDAPQGLVLFVNAAAHRAGVRKRMRYGTALSLAPDLRAGVVPGSEIDAGVAALTERLFAFTPGVEPAPSEPGVFHLDASGLSRLHGSVRAWTDAVLADLSAAGFRARIAAGFTRLGVYAAARTGRGAIVFATPEEELRAAHRVPLARLGADAVLVETLTKLGVVTVGDFLVLPEEGIARRFGDEALRLRRFASGGRGTPLVRTIPAEPLEETASLEHPETDAARLVFLAKRLTDRVLAKAAERRLAAAGVSLRLVLEGHPTLAEDLRVAAPTLDAAQILDLVQLRLGSLVLPSGVVGMTLVLVATPATEEQLQLFAERPRRDAAAAERAFARLAAEFGEDAVVVARLAEGHLPETQFVWETAVRLVPARPAIVEGRPLVRRILARPVPVVPPDRRDPDGWMPLGPGAGPVVRLSGPYRVATRWWMADEVVRESCFAETSRGTGLWLFCDAVSKTWLIHGRTE